MKAMGKAISVFLRNAAVSVAAGLASEEVQSLMHGDYNGIWLL